MSSNRYKCNLCNENFKKVHKHFRDFHPELYKQLQENTFEIFKFVERINTREPPTNKPQPNHKIITIPLSIHKFIWEDIEFDNKLIKIYIKREDKKFTPIKCEKSVKSLNLIKQ